MTIPEFAEKSQLIDWLVTNKSALIAQRKASVKHADACAGMTVLLSEKGEATKAELIPPTATKIKVRSIINTTKILDSHGDVHIDQLWNKSLKETKDNYLVKEHDFTFEGIISENVHAFAKQMTWAELGFAYEGSTQALVYDSVISKEDSPKMFEMYRRGKVKQHSVGMRYVKTELAVNDERYEKEYSVWNKYVDQIVNKEAAIEQGWFFAVTEAKNIEGSAVVKGSNFATPTYSIEEKSQPSKDTEDEPVVTTQKMDIGELLTHYKI